MNIRFQQIRNLFYVSVIAIFTLTISGCKKCKNSNPRVRIVNNWSQSAKVKNSTIDGRIYFDNEVAPNSTTSYQNISPMEVDVTLSAGGTSNFKHSLKLSNCNDYGIVILDQYNFSFSTTPTE